LALAVGLGLALVGLLLLPAWRGAKQRSHGVRCTRLLWQVGVAGAQYADDLRFFPHVGRIAELDGDVTSSDTPRAFRALLQLGYLEGPESLVCPASFDRAAPVVGAAAEDPGQWFWAGQLDPDVGPASALFDDAPDPALNATAEVSYGWTRRGLNQNAPSTRLLAADRAVRDPAASRPLRGNHVNGWVVVRADLSTPFLSVDDAPFPGASLVSTERGGGALPLVPQTDPRSFRQR
jgi:hypothetical protein